MRRPVPPLSRLGRRFVVAVLGALTLFAAACSVTPAAATVDGHRISRGDLEGELRDIASNDKYLKYVESQVPVRSNGVFLSSFTASILSRQIMYDLIHRDLARRKLAVTNSDLDAARGSVADRLGGEDVFTAFPKRYQDMLVRRSAEVSVLSFALLDQGPPDQAAKAYYDAHQDEFAQVCVSQILVGSKEEADQVKGRLDHGEDFGAVAKQVSKDTASAPQGGDLGCFGHDNQLVPEFAQAIFSQPVGQTGNPVQTQSGFHIFLVRSRTVPAYDQVAGKARDKAVSSAQNKLTAWADDTVNKARITVNPKYGRWDKQGAESRVVPPQAPTTAAPTTEGITPVAPVQPGP